jgi:hypothetical protein
MVHSGSRSGIVVGTSVALGVVWMGVMLGGRAAPPAVVPVVPPTVPGSPGKVDGVAVTPASAEVACKVDLKLPGTMADIVSNVLLRVEKKPAEEVRAFVKDAQKKYRTGEEALSAAAGLFGMDRAKLAEQVEVWKHVNCEHAPVAGYQRPDSADASDAGGVPVAVSAFAADVTLHVALHEMGHAVVREFDVAVLGNEETMADAFATHYLVEHMPGRALAALKARVKSLMIEAGEVPVEKWTVRGEHDNDARRAYQIAALAVAADAEKYAEVGALVGMSPREITKAKDYGADIHRAWRRTLAPIMMPMGRRSREWRFAADGATRAFVSAGEPGLEILIGEALGAIDWHSQVRVEFVAEGDGAAWNRSKRTITVGGDYLRRFVRQGEVTVAPPAKAGE